MHEPAHGARRVRRRAWTLLAAIVVLTLAAGPAAADPAGPTHYDARVVEVVGDDAATTPIAVDVLGGDAFLVIDVAEGSTVEVPGYEGEPYLRISADGAVEVNARSPARWLNDARYGQADVAIPASADASAPPVWEPVATGGRYAWHDHRIHFMSPALPPQVDPSARSPQPVFAWQVPLRVDGREVEIRGELIWLPGPPTAVPVVLVLTGAGVAIASLLRRPRWLSLTITPVALAAAVVGSAGAIGLPAGAEADPALVVLPLLSLVTVGVGAIAARRGPVGSPHPRGASAVASAGIPLVVWGVLQIGVLTRPVVPGPLPLAASRGVTLLALSVGAATVVLLAARFVARSSAPPAPPDPDAAPIDRPA